MDPALMALAGAAAQELVKLMTTDGWHAVRDQFARLFGRGDDQRAARHTEQLEASRAELVGGRIEQNATASRWQGRLEALLEEYPELAGQLTALVQQLREASGTAGVVSASGHGVAAGGNVQNIGIDGGIGAGVIHGSVSTGHPSQPRPHQG